VLTGEGAELPPALSEIAAHVTLPGPTDDEFRDLLGRIIRDMSLRQHVEVTLTPDERAQLLRHLSGLTLMEAEKILTKAIVEDGALGADGIQHVVEAKRKVIEREGLLEYYPVETTMAGVADLVTFKAWLAEFLRKGRFDEIFFVDLPDGATRIQVFTIHLTTRGHDADAFDLLRLAEETAGFSGSEIEEVVVSALYTAFSHGTTLDTGAISTEIQATRPLSVTMGEKIGAMRRWAEGRAVRAN
jgi:hypothetical protein